MGIKAEFPKHEMKIIDATTILIKNPKNYCRAIKLKLVYWSDYKTNLIVVGDFYTHTFSWNSKLNFIDVAGFYEDYIEGKVLATENKDYVKCVIGIMRYFLNANLDQLKEFYKKEAESQDKSIKKLDEWTKEKIHDDKNYLIEVKPFTDLLLRASCDVEFEDKKGGFGFVVPLSRVIKESFNYMRKASYKRTRNPLVVLKQKMEA